MCHGSRHDATARARFANTVDFFKQQEQARRQTWWLLLAFAIAVAIVVAALDVVALWALQDHSAFHHNRLGHAPAHPHAVLAVTLVVLGTILGASARKWLSFGEGGAAVARSLGGKRVGRADTDLTSQRLLNVVEEMAIAAGIPRPQVYVIPDQPGINAFAAGHSVHDAAIAVTSGTLTALNRDELQAVIGHEFSHILNGDMRLNLRLIAWLHGLFFVTVLGQWLTWSRTDRRCRRTAMVGIPVLVVGSIGLLVGRLLQSAVSRRREQLADASSVQFTRNPEGLKQALLKIAGHSAGSAVEAPQALEVAHLFFAASETSVWWRLTKLTARLFATHPPIAERIQALDPSFDPGSLVELARSAARAAEPGALVAANGPIAAGGLVAAYPGAAPQHAGSPGPNRAVVRGSEYRQRARGVVENPVTGGARAPK